MYLYLVTYNLYLYLPYSLFAKKGLSGKSVNQLAIDYWFSLRFSHLVESRISAIIQVLPTSTPQNSGWSIFSPKECPKPQTSAKISPKKGVPPNKKLVKFLQSHYFAAKGQIYCPSFFSEWAELRRGTLFYPGPVPNSLGGAVYFT